jgi:hypothetical protein
MMLHAQSLEHAFGNTSAMGLTVVLQLFAVHL